MVGMASTNRKKIQNFHIRDLEDKKDELIICGSKEISRLEKSTPDSYV